MKTGKMIISTSLRNAPSLNAKIDGVLHENDTVEVTEIIGTAEDPVQYGKTKAGKYFLIRVNDRLFWQEVMNIKVVNELVKESNHDEMPRKRNWFTG